MTTEQKIIRAKVGLLELAQGISGSLSINVTCRRFSPALAAMEIKKDCHWPAILMRWMAPATGIEVP